MMSASNLPPLNVRERFVNAVRERFVMLANGSLPERCLGNPEQEMQVHLAQQAFQPGAAKLVHASIDQSARDVD